MQLLATATFQAHIKPDEETLHVEILNMLQTGAVRRFSTLNTVEHMMDHKVIQLRRSVPVPDYTNRDEKLRQQYNIKYEVVINVEKCKK